MDSRRSLPRIYYGAGMTKKKGGNDSDKRETMSQLRQNIITGEWVVIATERARRPDEYIMHVRRKIVPKKSCVFCVGTETYKNRITDIETKHIYVATNKYPAFSGCDLVEPEKSGFFFKLPGCGDHELIITKDHDLKIANAPASLWEELLNVSQSRIKHFYSQKSIELAMLIYNHGSEAGASIQHPHAQLFGSPLLPNFVKMELRGAEHFYEKNHQCIFCEMIKSEAQNQIRVVHENAEFISLCFYASRFPFEMWILPKDHESNFEKIAANQMKSFSECLSVSLKKLYKSLNNPPWNFFIHSKPPENHVSSKAYHWHMEITPRVTRFGGFELGGDMIINVVAPEASAEFLRKTEVDHA